MIDALRHTDRPVSLGELAKASGLSWHATRMVLTRGERAGLVLNEGGAYRLV